MSTPRHPRLDESIALLRKLIATPSPSRDEGATASILFDALADMGVEDVRRFHNNIYAVAPGFDAALPTLMLNSHHDTVRPAAGYTRDPYAADIVNGRIYGLGSNDAGASVASLTMAFDEASRVADRRFNLILSLTAAEECMGEYGMRAFLPHLAENGLTPDMVIVGEPTGLRAAVAERGLVVLDGTTEGKSGHAARNEGINAIYLTMDDITALRCFEAPRVSPVLGPIKVSVTQIEAGTQHNVVPGTCRFVVDVRTTDAYSNAETVELLRNAVKYSKLEPRSTRVHPSVIDESHPLLRAAKSLGTETFVSPTTSDMALMYDIPSLKIGPGESARSHSADEYVEIDEINNALSFYPKLIQATFRNG